MYSYIFWCMLRSLMSFVSVQLMQRSWIHYEHLTQGHLWFWMHLRPQIFSLDILNEPVVHSALVPNKKNRSVFILGEDWNFHTHLEDDTSLAQVSLLGMKKSTLQKDPLIPENLQTCATNVYIQNRTEDERTLSADTDRSRRNNRHCSQRQLFSRRTWNDLDRSLKMMNPETSIRLLLNTTKHPKYGAFTLPATPKHKVNGL